MFNLRAEQRVFEVGGVKLGGIPGRNPTVLVGTISIENAISGGQNPRGLRPRTRSICSMARLRWSAQSCSGMRGKIGW